MYLKPPGSDYLCRTSQGKPCTAHPSKSPAQVLRIALLLCTDLHRKLPCRRVRPPARHHWHSDPSRTAWLGRVCIDYPSTASQGAIGMCFLQTCRVIKGSKKAGPKKLPVLRAAIFGIKYDDQLMSNVLFTSLNPHSRKIRGIERNCYIATRKQ